MRLFLFFAIAGCHPGCQPPVEAGGDSSVGHDSHAPNPEDTGQDEDTGEPQPLNCDPPAALTMTVDADAGAQGGKALAWTRGPTPMLAVGVPEATDGAGAVRLLDDLGDVEVESLTSAHALTVGRGLAAGPDGELAVAALLDPIGAQVWWIDDPGAGGAILDEAPSYRTDDDGSGVALATLYDRDLGAVLLMGLPQANANGSVWVLPPPQEGENVPSELGLELFGERANDFAGTSVAAAGDVNADGHPDLLVGAFGYDGVGPMSGRAYLVHGPIVADAALGDADAQFDGADSWDLFGWAVSGAGDADNDGYDDVVIGSPGTNGVELSSGAAYVFSGNSTDVLATEAAFATVVGSTDDARVGWSVAQLATSPGRIAVGGPGFSTQSGGVWAPDVSAGGIVVLEAPMFVGEARSGAGTTLAVGRPDAAGCDTLAVGGPDGGLVWVLSTP